ncbi:retrovirus-related pol polyprotein from transposon TNT 1-94 [Tanacetum coccineum]
MGKLPSSSGSKLYAVTPFPKSKGLPKIDETHALSKPVTSNSVPTPQESKGVKNDNVIAPRMYRINPFKPFRKEKYVPNKVRESVRIKPITVSQPHVINKKDVNFDSNGFPSTEVDNIAKTRRPQLRSNTKNDRVPSESKSSCIKNKEVKVEEHHRNLLLSKNKKHMSSKCNNVKLAIQNDKSEVVFAMCKQCLITANHDVCVLNYVNGMNYANVSKTANQKKHKPHVKKPKKVGSKERLASPKPSIFLRWSPTRKIFDLCGKIIESSDSKYEATEEIKTFLKKITVLLQAPVIIVRTDNDTEFKNQVLQEYFNSVGISHQASSVRTPQQNGVVKRRNRTLVEAARTMLIFSHAPYSLLSPKNDYEDIGKLGAKGDIGFFIGYSATSYAYKVCNRRTKKIMETMNVTFDELSAMAFEQSSLKPGLQSMTF